MKKSLWFFLSFVVIVLDQSSKYAVLHALQPYEPWGITPFFNITLAFNTGVAFGVFQGHPEWLAVLSFVMSVVLVWVIARTSSEDTGLLWSLSLILGGAVGNGLDRAFRGYVVDFLDFHIYAHHFAIFNIADSAISIGILLLLLDGLRASGARARAHNA